MSFKRILVPTDGSEITGKAVATAIDAGTLLCQPHTLSRLP